MKNLKVSMKLIVSFLIVIALSVIVGAVGIFGMYQINAADDALYNDNYLPTVLAGSISQSIVEQRVYMRSLVIYDVKTEADIFNSAKTSLDNTKGNMSEYIKQYDGNIILQEDRDTFNSFVSVYNNEWVPLLDEVYKLGMANKTAEAKVVMTDGAAVAAKLDELTTKLQQINLDDGEKSVNGNTSLFRTMTIAQVIVLGVAITIAMMLVFYISGLISKPLILLTKFMTRASSTGDLTLSKEDQESIAASAKIKDEIGECIGSTADFVKRITDISDALEIVAGGDLTVEMTLLSDRDTMGLSLQKMVDNLNNMFGEIHASTTQVSIGSTQMADGAQALAQGSTQQAAAVEQLSSSISEIAQKTRDNAEMAMRAASLANTIKQNAEKGSSQMDQMTDAVKEINEASQSINKVIKVIDDIAFQTNILALNAAVEAARAGQHGKGFAVVAEEVRNLAAKSADAAKDTGSLIANSMEKAELGARIADETATSLVEIVAGINESNQIVGEIARSSEEQSNGIDQINKGIDQVAQVIQQNSATAEESAAASEEMSGQASMLDELVSHFKLKQNQPGVMLSSTKAASSSKQLDIPKYESPSDNLNLGKY